MKTKVQLNWEVGKEQEQLFVEYLKTRANNIIDGIDIEELFAQIRQNEYRRGKEDGANEARKEMITEWIKYLDMLRDFNINSLTIENNIHGKIMELKQQLGGKE